MARILVINNDIDTMSLLRDWLERKKYIVKYTSDSQEVLHLVREFKPNSIS